MIKKTYKQSIIELTKVMSDKERFAYVSFPKSSILVASGRISNDKRPPKYFTKAVQNSLSINDKNYFKAIPYYLLEGSSGFDILNIPQIKDMTAYDGSLFEYMYSSNKLAFDSFVEFYIRYNKNIIITFHDKKSVQNIVGMGSKIIHVPYNDFYDRIDSIFDLINNHKEDAEYCILDCPVLSSALASKIWSKSSMSILDFGKVFSLSNRQ